MEWKEEIEDLNLHNIDPDKIVMIKEALTSAYERGAKNREEELTKLWKMTWSVDPCGGPEECVNSQSLKKANKYLAKLLSTEEK